jgi:hypothetical protein
MADPVLALVLLAVFFLAVTLAHAFKTLDAGIWREARTPLVVGLIVGVALRFVEDEMWRLVATGVLLTLAALYVRLIGRESEPAEGMTLGAMTGAGAALPLIISVDESLLALASCLLAGAIAGYGITFGLSHVRDKLRQALVDLVTAAQAIGGAYLPLLLARRLTDRNVAIAAVALIPLLIVGAVFKQWPAIRAELRDEVGLGVLDDTDIRPTAHPFLRLGRAGWHDAGAHREFVRMANAIALRKRQQRHRSEEIARLYQLEVIKLRMQMQEMSAIDRRMRAAAGSPAAAGDSSLRSE